MTEEIVLDDESAELLEKLAETEGVSQESEMAKLISDFCKENETGKPD